jgi:hypothetical protein
MSDSATNVAQSAGVPVDLKQSMAVTLLKATAFDVSQRIGRLNAELQREHEQLASIMRQIEDEQKCEGESQ